MYDAFLSYARKDAVHVERLHQILENAQFDIWRDTEDLPAGDVWRQTLRDAIIDSDNLLFVISPASVDSRHCAMELEFALQHNKRIIPILYSKLRDDQRLPDNLDARQWLTLDWNNLDAAAIAPVLRDEAGWRNRSSDYLRRAKNWEEGIGGVLPRIELEQARTWLESGARMDPGPLEIQVRFIQQSEAFHLDEAERWKALYAKTLATKLAAQAEGMIAQQGVLLETAALLAVESMRRSPSAVGDRALRTALFLLPREVSKIDWPEGKAPRETAFSPDGKYVAVLYESETVHVYECASGFEVRRLEASQCLSLRFQPGARRLMTVGASVTVWSLDADGPSAEVSHEALADAAYSGDGAFLATVGADGVTRLWDTDDYQELATYANAAPMTKVVVAAEGREIIAWNQDFAEVFRFPGQTGRRIDLAGRIGVFEYDPTGHYLSQLSPSDFSAALHDVRARDQILFEERHWHAAFSGDGRYYGLASPEWDAYAYDLPSAWQAGNYWEFDGSSGMMQRKHVHRRVSCRRGETVHHDNSINSVSLSHTGLYLATTSRDGTARVWEQRRGREVLRLLEAVVGPVHKLAFSADERYVSGIGARGCATWEATGHRQVAALHHGDAVLDVSCSGDGRYAATASKDGTLRVWSIPDGAEVQRISHKPDPLAHPTVLLNREGSKLLLEGRDVWDVVSGSTSGRTPLDAQRVGAVADDWTCAAVIRDDNGISMVSLDDGRELAGRDSYGAAIDAVAICPSNQLAAVALQEQGLRIWDWRQAVDLETSARAIRPRTMRFSSTGALLAIVDDQDRRMVHVLNLSAPADSPRTFPHEAEVTSACLHPGDSFLLTTGSDYGVRVWSLEPGDLVAEFKHDADVITARFSPDGRYVLSAGGRSDRTARLWIWRPEDLVAEACGRISRDLTQEEWDQYLGEEPYRRTRELADDVNTDALS